MRITFFLPTISFEADDANVCSPSLIVSLAAGLSIFRAALADASITKITVLTRREMPSWAVLPPNASSKADFVIQTDFRTYTPDLARKLAAHDACVWALGKSAVGMNEKDYTELTLEYPLALLNALKEGGVSEGRQADKPFRFVYISGENADPEMKSSQMWARVKVHFMA